MPVTPFSFTTDAESPCVYKSAGPLDGSGFSFFEHAIKADNGWEAVGLVLGRGVKLLVQAVPFQPEVVAAKTKAFHDRELKYKVPHRGSRVAVVVIINNMLLVCKEMRDFLLKVPQGSKPGESVIALLCSELGISVSSNKFCVDKVIDRAGLQFYVEGSAMSASRVNKAAAAMAPKVDEELAKLLEKLGVKEVFDKLSDAEREKATRPLLDKAATAAEAAIYKDPKVVFERSPGWVLQAHLDLCKLLFMHDSPWIGVRAKVAQAAMLAIAQSQDGGVYEIIRWLQSMVAESHGLIRWEKYVEDVGSDGGALGEMAVSAAGDAGAFFAGAGAAAEEEEKAPFPDTPADMPPPELFGNVELQLFNRDILKELMWPHLAAPLFGECKSVPKLLEALEAYSEGFDYVVRYGSRNNWASPLVAIAANGKLELIETALKHGEVVALLHGYPRSYISSDNPMTQMATEYIKTVKPAPEDLADTILALNAQLAAAYQFKIAALAADGIPPGHVGLAQPGSAVASRTSLINVAVLLKAFLQERNVAYARAVIEMMKPYMGKGPPIVIDIVAEVHDGVPQAPLPPPMYFYFNHTWESPFMYTNGSVDSTLKHFEALMRWCCDDTMHSYHGDKDNTAELLELYDGEGPTDVWERALTSMMRYDCKRGMVAVWPKLCKIGQLHCLRRAIEYRPGSTTPRDKRVSNCLQWMLSNGGLTNEQVCQGMKWAMGGSSSNTEHKRDLFYNDPYAIVTAPGGNMNMNNISALMLHPGITKPVVVHCIESHKRGTPVAVLESFVRMAERLVDCSRLTRGDYDSMLTNIRAAKQSLDRATRGASSSASARADASESRSRRGVVDRTQPKRRKVRAGGKGQTFGARGVSESESDPDDYVQYSAAGQSASDMEDTPSEGEGMRSDSEEEEEEEEEDE